MTKNIDRMHPRNGRYLAEDDSLVNILDLTRGIGVAQKPPVSMPTDRLGRAAKISQKGEIVTALNTDDVNVNFQYGIRPADVATTLTGTGEVSHIGSTAGLSPGAGVGSAELTSLGPVRYRSGHESYAEMSWIFRTPEENLNQYAGFLNDNDRLCVGYQGDVFGMLFTEGGNETFVPMAGASIDPLDGTGPSGMVVNPQAINVYRLSFVWHGGLPLTVEVSYQQQWWPVHVFDFSNVISEPHLENPHLPVGGRIERTIGTGTDDPMKSGSWRGGVIGGSTIDSRDYWATHTVLDATLLDDRNNIFTIVNPATWKGKLNHVVYELGIVTFTSDANKTVAVYGVDGATVSGGGTQTAIDADNSPLEFINGGTLTGGARGPATVIKSGADRRTDVRDTGIRLYPGRQFSFEVEPGGAVNGTFSISARWRGEH